jgi:hypothetical protein
MHGREAIRKSGAGRLYCASALGHADTDSATALKRQYHLAFHCRLADRPLPLGTDAQTGPAKRTAGAGVSFRRSAISLSRGVIACSSDDLDAHRLGSGHRGRAHGLFWPIRHELVGQREGFSH